MPLSQAQQNLLRQAQEYSQETGQTPDKVTELTAAHGDLTGSTKQRTPPGQRAGAQRRGRRADGGLSQAQQNLLRQAQEYSTDTGQTPDKVTELTKQYGDLTSSTQQRTPPGQRGGAQRRGRRAEGGDMSSMLVAPEDEIDAIEAEQLPDEEMEEDHVGFILGESLDETEQEYLMNALESDPELSAIFDKVMDTASEFSGAGEVEGPGTGVSDSIPARLSDGEFVVTEEATDEIGADNLQAMMDDAERESEKHGGLQHRSEYAGGGLLDDPNDPYGAERGNPLAEDDDEEIHRSMLGANQMPSLVGSRR